jgi:hypothetical protein
VTLTEAHVTSLHLRITGGFTSQKY